MIGAAIAGAAASVALPTPASLAGELLSASPIDYVRVCAAHGEGYAYIAGAQACLAVGGTLQFDAYLYDRDGVLTEVKGYGPKAYRDRKRGQRWQFTSEAQAWFTAKADSDLGPVEATFELTTSSDWTDWNGTVENARVVTWDYGHGAIGPLAFGYDDSTFDYDGGGPGYTYDGTINSDSTVDFVRLSHEGDVFGAALGLEDPRDRYGGGANVTGDWPDVVLALSAKGHVWDAQLSAAVTDRTTGTGWGAQLGWSVGADKGPQLIGAVAASGNAPSYVGGDNCAACANQGFWWSAFVSGKLDLSASWSSAATVSYLGGPKPGDDSWQAAAGAYYAPHDVSEIGFELSYTGGSDPSLGFHTRLTTSFGGS